MNTNKKSNNKKVYKIKDYEPICSSPDVIMAIGKTKISGEHKTATFDIKYLKKAIAILDQLEKTTATFVIGDDSPLIIGSYDHKKKEANGVIIAPRIDNGK